MSRSLIVTAFLSALLATSAIPGLARAQSAGSVTLPIGNAYVGFSAGALIPSDTRQSMGGTLYGMPVSATGKMRYKPGIIVDALVGYHLNPYLGGEFDLSYARYTYDRIDGTLHLGPTTVNGSNFDGNIQYWMGFANAIVTPWGRDRFVPYIGAGIGFSSYRARIDSASNPSLGTVAINSTTTNTDFAANALVGVDYAVDESFSLGVRYRYLWTDSARMVMSGTLTSDSSNATHHVLSARAVYHF